MTSFGVKIRVDHKDNVGPDPESTLMAAQLDKLGFNNVDNVKVSKVLSFVLEAADAAQAAVTVGEMCDKFLVNDVYEIPAVNIHSLDPR